MISIDDNISSVERKLEEFFLTLNHNYFGDMLDKPLIVIKSDLKNSQKYPLIKYGQMRKMNTMKLVSALGF